MSITKIDSPTAYVAGYLVGQTDYTQQNLKTEAALGKGQNIFTDPTSISTTVSLKQGAFIYHAGSTYQVQGEDYSISFTSGGVNYITLAGTDTLEVTLVQDKSGFAWNAAYNGMYNDDGDLLLPFYLYYTTSTSVEIFEYINKSSLVARISLYDGSIVDLDTGGEGLTTSGGDINTEGGDISLGSGDIDNGTGHFLPCTSPTAVSLSASESKKYIPAATCQVVSISITVYSDGSGTRTGEVFLDCYVNGAWTNIYSQSAQSASGSNTEETVIQTLISSGSNWRYYVDDDTYITSATVNYSKG